ncbi:unnamed protein product [Dicrocoelium dendriticum]|nr:unnamed protein product [Dicrocoelium dendriticum]
MFTSRLNMWTGTLEDDSASLETADSPTEVEDTERYARIDDVMRMFKLPSGSARRFTSAVSERQEQYLRSKTDGNSYELEGLRDSDQVFRFMEAMEAISRLRGSLSASSYNRWKRQLKQAFVNKNIISRYTRMHQIYYRPHPSDFRPQSQYVLRRIWNRIWSMFKKSQIVLNNATERKKLLASLHTRRKHDIQQAIWRLAVLEYDRVHRVSYGLQLSQEELKAYDNYFPSHRHLRRQPLSALESKDWSVSGIKGTTKSLKLDPNAIMRGKLEGFTDRIPEVNHFSKSTLGTLPDRIPNVIDEVLDWQSSSKSTSDEDDFEQEYITTSEHITPNDSTEDSPPSGLTPKQQAVFLLPIIRKHHSTGISLRDFEENSLTPQNV